MQLNFSCPKTLIMMNLLSSPSAVSATRTATRSLIMSLLSSPSLNSATRTLTTSSTNTPPMVKIISQETIKPSSPTPYHLRTHKLSLLDHLAPPIYICFTLFYDQIHGRHNRNEYLQRHLKKTLAETLADFYPLAGKVKYSHEGFKFIDCTDDGVEYLEARVNAQLHETINKDPDMYLLNQFLPLNPCQLVVRNTGSGSSSESSSQPILAVQVNTFECGGLAVGVSMSHEVSDNSGLVYFMQAWAAKAHGGSDTKPVDVDPPLIGFESLFPIRAIPEGSILLFREDIASKRFVFDSSKISSLKEKMMISMNDGSYLTRVEVLTTFMWRRFMNIHQAKIRSGQTARSLQLCVGQAVNVRKRINLSPNSFGNLYFSSLLPMFSIDGSESSDKDYKCFMSRLRDTVHNINGDYVRRELQSGEDGEFLKFEAKVGEGLCGGELETLNFTSWCRMGYYEVDFGWGKPVWMYPGTIPYKDVVLFTDTKSGDRIEVWVYMIQEDIDALERDKEFLAYVS